MYNRRIWIAVTVVTFGIFMFMPVAQAQRQEFEAISCNVATENMVHSSSDVRFSAFDQKGITQSTHASKLFDNWTRHSVFVFKGIGGEMRWNGVAKHLAPDGEYIIWEFSGDNQSGTTAKAIYGTGKWKGIKGESNNRRFTTGKSIAPNTDQFCERVVGWIELPK